jgi:hypothetical protein
MELDLRKGLQALYNWDFDHALDGPEPEEDDLAWLDDLFAIYEKEVAA